MRAKYLEFICNRARAIIARAGEPVSSDHPGMVVFFMGIGVELWSDGSSFVFDPRGDATLREKSMADMLARKAWKSG